MVKICHQVLEASWKLVLLIPAPKETPKGFHTTNNISSLPLVEWTFIWKKSIKCKNYCYEVFKSYFIMIWRLMSRYCKFGNFREGFIFAKLRSFLKIKPSWNGKITLSFTDVGKSGSSRKFLTSQICLLTLFAKIKLSRKISGFTVIKIWTTQLWMFPYWSCLTCFGCKKESSHWDCSFEYQQHTFELKNKRTDFFVCLAWFFTNQSTIIQLLGDRSSWVEPVMCLAQGHNAVMPVRLKPTALWSWVNLSILIYKIHTLILAPERMSNETTWDLKYVLGA